MIVTRRHQHDAVTKADVFRALRTGGEKHFRRGGMGIFLQKMMLHLPGVIDAETVGQFDLIQRVLKQLQLVAVMPGARQLMLIKNTELHCGCSYWSCGAPGISGAHDFTLFSASLAAA